MFHVKQLRPIFETLKAAQKFYLNQILQPQIVENLFKMRKTTLFE